MRHSAVTLLGDLLLRFLRPMLIRFHHQSSATQHSTYSSFRFHSTVSVNSECAHQSFSNKIQVPSRTFSTIQYPSQASTETRVYGFDLNEHFQADKDHYDPPFHAPFAHLPSPRSWTLKDVILSPSSSSSTLSTSQQPLATKAITREGNVPDPYGRPCCPPIQRSL